MSMVAGYFLILDQTRYSLFLKNEYDRFAEPVPEFSHSRHVPLICFVANDAGNITHIGLGKRGSLAGTGLRRLNIGDIFELKNSISATMIVDNTRLRVRKHLNNKIQGGGLFPHKSFEEFLKVFMRNNTDAIPLLDKYSQSRQSRISRLSKNTSKSLAEQKEAILTAMNIAGINRDNAQGWDYNESEGPTSFLDGISHVRLREDSIIINDLSNIPGFNLIKSTKYSSSVFENDKTKTRLTVLLANRLPLEELLGTDLIYFNEDYKCFIMVQYKAMEREGYKLVFRLPNSQFTEEISRMDSIAESLKSTVGNSSIDDFRFNENPFFVKICPRLEFNPDNVGLSTGMYIPIEYIKILANDKSIAGKRGGKSIQYDNVGRYLDNTAFKTIVEGGWIGTNQNQSILLEQIIKNILENGKAAVIAIKKNIMQNLESDLLESDEEEFELDF